jgi:hypothetical protein
MDKVHPGVPGTVLEYIELWRKEGKAPAVDVSTLRGLGHRSLEDYGAYRRECADTLERLATWGGLRAFWNDAAQKRASDGAGTLARAVVVDCLLDWRRLAGQKRQDRKKELTKIGREARLLAKLVQMYEREGFSTLNEGAIFLDGHPFFADEKITRDFICEWRSEGNRRDDMMRIVRRALPVPSQWLNSLARQAEKMAGESLPKEVPSHMNKHTFVCRWLEGHLPALLPSGVDMPSPTIRAAMAGAICDDMALDYEVYRVALRKSGK